MSASSAVPRKTVEDLTDEELLIVFRDPASPLDAFDLVNLELVCKRWRQLARSNEVWAKHLPPPTYKEEDVALLKQKGLTGCRDWWCLQHFLQQEFWKEYTRRRNMHAEAGDGGAAQA